MPRNPASRTRRSWSPITKTSISIDLWLGAGLVLSGCSARVFPDRGEYDRETGGYSAGSGEAGEVSYYADAFHGRKTASGEIFDMNAMTAAHRTLPFGTRLRVHNLDNGKSAIVRVNDRGPFAKDRILDVSKAAAKELGMIGKGTARARLEVIGSSRE